MEHAIRKQTVVKPGGIIEVQDVDLPDGAEAEVIVLLKEASDLSPLSSLIGAATGTWKTPEAADEYLQKLRDEWD